jgi:hypothetical protein
MTEVDRDLEQDPRSRVLGLVDQIVAENPKSQALMPDSSTFTFSVGRCAAYGQQGTPRQVIVANKPAHGFLGRTTTVAVRALDPREDFRVWHVDPEQAADVFTGEALDDEKMDELHGLLSETEFDDGTLVLELQERMSTPNRYSRWVEALVDERPIAQL